MNNAAATHTEISTLNNAAVGDRISAALAETMGGEWLEAFAAAGIEIAVGSDDRLVLVDAA